MTNHIVKFKSFELVSCRFQPQRRTSDHGQVVHSPTNILYKNNERESL